MKGAGRRVLAALLLAAAPVALFWPATAGDFVFDDGVFVQAGSPALAGLGREGLAWAFRSTEVSLYAPLARLSGLLDFQLWGGSPFGHHLTSLLLHGAVAALVFLALEALTGAFWRSAAVGALCAAHPLRVEPAAWVSGRGDLLAALFGLLALLAWGRYLRRRRRVWAALAVGAFLLGMLGKTILVTLPFALLLLDVWPLGRLRLPWGGGGPKRGAGASGVGPLLVEKAGFLLVAAALAGVSLYLVQRGPMAVSAERYSLAARAATSLVSYAFYVGKTLWPTGLTVFYPHRWGAFAWWEPAGAAVLLACASAAAIAAWRRRPYLAVGWLWFLGMLLPVIGLYQARQYPVADRYAYLPQLGLFVAAVWGVAGLARGFRRGEAAASAAVLALILACVPASRAQVRTWRDDESLFRHAIAVTGGNWLAEYNYGASLADLGRHGEAVEHFREAIRLNPDLAEARNNLGTSLDALGLRDEAIASFREAVRLKPGLAQARYNLAATLAAAGRHAEAVEVFRAFVAASPADAEAHFRLGGSLYALGRREEAAASLREALRLRPDYPEARAGLALAVGGRGD